MSNTQQDNREIRNSEPRKMRNNRDHREKEARGPSHVHIDVAPGEPIEKAIRKFKKLCEKAGIKKELKARRYYEKPSEARRREERKKVRNRQKLEKKGGGKDSKFGKEAKSKENFDS